MADRTQGTEPNGGLHRRPDAVLDRWAGIRDRVSLVLLHPNTLASLDALLALRIAVITLAVTLLAIVGLLWNEVRGSYLLISGTLALWLILVTVGLALIRSIRSERVLTLVILVAFLSDLTLELVLLGAADTTRSAFLLFPLGTVVSAALIGGNRTAVICLVYLSVGYPFAVFLGTQGVLAQLTPPFEQIQTLPQILYHSVSQMTLVGMVLAMFVYVVSRLRSQTQVYDDQLQQARHQIEHDTLRRANEQHLVQMGRMTAFLAHELRNPLTAILTSAELVEMDIDDHELIRESTTDIKDQTLRLSRMLTDVLDYTREFQPAATSHDLFPFLEDLVDSTRAGSDIEWDGPLSLPVFVDAGHAQQILHNLIRNATQAAGTEGKVRISGDLLGQEQVCIEIHDDGPGIHEEDRERIFEAFFTTKPKGEGTGLGLAICRRLCNLNSVQLDVAASELGGARFRIILPAALSGQLLEVQSRPSVETTLLPRGDPHQMPTILVVEDEDRLRINVQRTISREGYIVVVAANLFQARKAITEHHPQVILLDLSLGDEDGAELMKDLPDDDSRPAVLVTSAYSDGERRHRMQALGVAGYLVKPIRRKELLQAIREQIDGSVSG